MVGFAHGMEGSQHLVDVVEIVVGAVGFSVTLVQLNENIPRHRFLNPKTAAQK
jgi:hypothetical protein